MMDNITVTVDCDDQCRNSFEEYREYIMGETLAVEFNTSGSAEERFDINGHDTGIDIVKR